MNGQSARGADRGYALLALLASSAILLAALALSVPRMAMQAQRLKDSQLIERGEQYRRAIKLYYEKHGKYPAELEDLEETDGVRYLRRRYKDPIGVTGEWRLIHMGTDGKFEDSLLHDLDRDQSAFGGARSPGGAFGMQGPNAGGSLFQPAATNRNDSSGQQRSTEQASGPPNRASAVRRSAAPDLATATPYNQGFAFSAGEAAPSGAEDLGDESRDRSMMLPSMVPMDENDPARRGPFEGFGPTQLGRDLRTSRFGPGSSQGEAELQGDPQVPSGPVAANQAGLAAGSGAAEVINRLLTGPRSRNLEGPAGMQRPGATAPVFERGIAGVASKSEGNGVRTYNGKEAYMEWEFVYDYRKDTDPRANGGASQPTLPDGPSPGRKLPAGQRGRAF